MAARIGWVALAAMSIILSGGVVGAEPAQSTAAGKRPRVCLVLSGGGARGAAHVGVLRVLEEYRVPIDCVVGTSMGSLVGAAYVTGMSLPEMDTIIGSISTELLFKERPPRQQLTMRRKEDDHTILFSPEVGVSNGEIKVGKGLVSGVQLETVLRRLSRTQGYYHFDSLPIQYRAVATDLVTGKAVIFKEGDMAQVMRASMSVPGAVAPAEFDGMILVDGMLTSNLPVQTAREMGADVIIAVNVGTPLLTREELSGVFGVTGQMLSILTEQNVQESLKALQDQDILISPDLQNYSTADFDALPKIVPLGEDAARKAEPRLMALSVSEKEYARFEQRRRIAAAPETAPVDEIRFENLHRVNPESALAVMDTTTGKPIDQATLDADMRRIYGTGDFEHVNYRFLEEPGRRVLAVDAVEKSWGPDYLRFGLGLSTDFQGNAFFNLLASYRQTWINSLGAEWRNDFQVGRASSISTEFYQPLNARNYFFIAPHANYERRSVSVYQDEDPVASYDIDSGFAGIDLGSQFYRFGELRLGIVAGEVSPKLDTGPAIFDPGRESVQQGAYTLRLLFDQLDSVTFPRYGWHAGAKIFDSHDNLGAENVYTKWDADGSYAYSFHDHTFNFGFKAGGSLDGDPLPVYDQFQWGGFMQQSGYATGQLLGERIQFGRIVYYHRLAKALLFDGTYGGISFEVGQVEDPLIPTNSDGVLKSGAIFLGSDTPIGPAYLGYGHAADGNNAFYFFLGRPY